MVPCWSYINPTHKCKGGAILRKRVRIIIIITTSIITFINSFIFKDILLYHTGNNAPYICIGRSISKWIDNFSFANSFNHFLTTKHLSNLLKFSIETRTARAETSERGGGQEVEGGEGNNFSACQGDVEDGATHPCFESSRQIGSNDPVGLLLMFDSHSFSHLLDITCGYIVLFLLWHQL